MFCQELKVSTCGDLRKIPLAKLQSVFGEKIGQKYCNYARGIDEHSVQNQTSRKSVSAEINYGNEMVIHFIFTISTLHITCAVMD